MIGIILTGHGQYAPGLASSVKMIVGETEHFEVVAFEETESSDDFKVKLEQSVKSLKSKTDDILVLSDLVGGTPFKTAMALGQTTPNLEVIGGANLPMIIETTMLRMMGGSLHELVDSAISIGQLGIQNIKLETVVETSEEILVDGI